MPCQMDRKRDLWRIVRKGNDVLRPIKRTLSRHMSKKIAMELLVLKARRPCLPQRPRQALPLRHPP